MSPRTIERRSNPGLRLVSLLGGAALLALAVGCASTPTDSGRDARVAASDSRCAPGSILDDRHSLCNGRSGRWW